MATENIINEDILNLINGMSNDEFKMKDFKDTLDKLGENPHFDIDFSENMKNLSEYWNESVYKAIEKCKEKIEAFNKDYGFVDKDGNIIKKDAANSFLATPYVSPWKNFSDVDYLAARTDENYSVLQNDECLDYTQDIQKNIEEYEATKEKAEAILNALTRLIMPQYKRKVEVEDLNRNFWVISQNLSMLNKFIMNLDKGLGDLFEDIYGEIAGLWNNIYKVWQAILYLSSKIDTANDEISKISQAAAKIKVKFAYDNTIDGGRLYDESLPKELLKRMFSNADIIIAKNEMYKRGLVDVDVDVDSAPIINISDPNYPGGLRAELNSSMNLKKGDEKYFGLYPIIEKDYIKYFDNNGQTKQGIVAYFPYNKTLNIERDFDISKFENESARREAMEEAFLTQYDTNGNRIKKDGTHFIEIEQKFGNTPVDKIIQDVRSQNYVLLSTFCQGENDFIENLSMVRNIYLNYLQFQLDLLCRYKEKTLNDFLNAGNTDLFSQKLRALRLLNFSTVHSYNEKSVIPEDIRDVLKYFIDNSKRHSEENGFPTELCADDLLFLTQACKSQEGFKVPEDIKDLDDYLGSYSKAVENFYSDYKYLLELCMMKNRYVLGEDSYKVYNLINFESTEKGKIGVYTYQYEQILNYDTLTEEQKKLISKTRDSISHVGKNSITVNNDAPRFVFFLTDSTIYTNNNKEINDYFDEDYVRTANESSNKVFKLREQIESDNEDGTILQVHPFYMVAHDTRIFNVKDTVVYMTYDKVKFKIDPTKLMGEDSYLTQSDDNYISNKKNPIIQWDLISSRIPKSSFRKDKILDITNVNIKDENKDKLGTTFNDILSHCGWFLQNASNAFGSSYLYPEDTPITGYWFDFINQPGQSTPTGGEIRTFTSNSYNSSYCWTNGDTIFEQGLIWAYRNTYNFDISIPFKNVARKKYWDFIRYNKPYPSLKSLLLAKARDGQQYDHIKEMNNVNNYLRYTEALFSGGLGIEIDSKFDNYAIDGFVGFDSMSEYPSLKEVNYMRYMVNVVEAGTNEKYYQVQLERSRFARGYNYFGPMYYSNKNYTISSTDLVNAHINNSNEILEGSTKWENTNLEENPAVFISYLSGSTPEQQLSIFISKDSTKGDWLLSSGPNIETDPVAPSSTLVLNDIDSFRIGDRYSKKVGDIITTETDNKKDSYRIYNYSYTDNKDGTYSGNLGALLNSNSSVETDVDIWSTNAECITPTGEKQEIQLFKDQAQQEKYLKDMCINEGVYEENSKIFLYRNGGYGNFYDNGTGVNVSYCKNDNGNYTKLKENENINDGVDNTLQKYYENIPNNTSKIVFTFFGEGFTSLIESEVKNKVSLRQAGVASMIYRDPTDSLKQSLGDFSYRLRQSFWRKRKLCGMYYVSKQENETTVVELKLFSNATDSYAGYVPTLPQKEDKIYSEDENVIKDNLIPPVLKFYTLDSKLIRDENNKFSFKNDNTTSKEGKILAIYYTPTLTTVAKDERQDITYYDYFASKISRGKSDLTLLQNEIFYGLWQQNKNDEKTFKTRFNELCETNPISLRRPVAYTYISVKITDSDNSSQFELISDNTWMKYDENSSSWITQSDKMLGDLT